MGAGRWVWAATCALVLGACTNLVPPADPFPRAGAPLPVSGQSPFHDCANQGQIALDSEVEPSLAVAPDDPNHLLATWQQDRNFRGGALGILTASSADGGRTWQNAQPAITACAGGPYDLASDPVVAIGPDRAYLAALAIHVVGSGLQTSFDDEVVVLASTDRGMTWSRPVVVVTSSNPLVSFDKETLVTDPRVAGTAYVLGVQYTNPGPGRPARTNQTFFSRTTDAGATWSTPVLAYDGGTETQFHQLAMLEDGSLLDAFIQGRTLSDRPPIPATLAVIRSTDRGATWSAPTTAASVTFTAVVDPTGKDQVRGTGQGVMLAIGPGGVAYICWAEQHAQGESFLSVVRSEDHGATWTSPKRVVSATSGQPFIPQIAVTGDGRVGVTWYQLSGGAGDQLATEAWLAWSTDRGDSWQSLRLAGPFDLHTAKLTEGGDFVGDYEGLVGLPAGFGAAYAMAKPLSRTGATDVFFSGIELGPPP